MRIQRSIARRFLAIALALLLVSHAHSQSDQNERIDLLIESGAFDLAFQIIDRYQADHPEKLDEWLGWERQRYKLYQEREEWERLVERLAALPFEIPEFRRHELITYGAELLLASEHGDRVRELLRSLIWSGSGDSVQITHWRRLVIRSYLNDDATEDAITAMRLYDQEYLPADTYWDYLYAEALLRSGDASGAAERLSTVQDDTAQVLRMLSRLRAGIDSPKDVLDDALAFRKSLKENSRLEPVVWALAAEAAALALDGFAQVNALEQLFNGPKLPSGFGLFDLSTGDLWVAYEQYGSELGNRENLLFGDPEPWMDLALSLKGEGSALKARALNATVARRSQSLGEREALHIALVERLGRANLPRLIVRLYQSEEEFETVQDVPVAVRHRIVAYAIDRRDMKLAAGMARDLEAPDTEQTKAQWDLIRARLAIYAGDFDQGESILRALIDSQDSFSSESADQIVQPVFDLQTAGRAGVTYELLDGLYQRVADKKFRREMLMWMGDAKRAEELDQEAALLYLRSAYLGDPNDLWAQSARYNAADALADAGLVSDAERIYEDLLKQTHEKNRVVVLQRKLQELWLQKQ